MRHLKYDFLNKKAQRYKAEININQCESNTILHFRNIATLR